MNETIFHGGEGGLGAPEVFMILCVVRESISQGDKETKSEVVSAVAEDTPGPYEKCTCGIGLDVCDGPRDAGLFGGRASAFGTYSARKASL